MHQARNQGVRKGCEAPLERFSPPLEKCAGYSLKLLDTVKKIWAPLRKFFASPGVPSWLRASCLKRLKLTFNGTFSVFNKTIGTNANQMTQVVYIVKPAKSHKLTIANRQTLPQCDDRNRQQKYQEHLLKRIFVVKNLLK